MKRLAFAVPGDLATPTGGYIYDRRMIDELQKIGFAVEIVGLGDGFPRPNAAQKELARERLVGVAEGCPIVVDGLALGVLPEAAEAVTRRLIALVHHPLAYETGVSPELAQSLWESEKKALACAAHVIVTSPSTARLLQESYDVPPELITVAVPGTDPAAPAAGSRNGVLHMISVGAVVPRKGFDVLVAALAGLADLPWRLTIVGDRGRDPPTAERLVAAIAELGLTDRIRMLDAVPSDRLAELYDKADLFVLASHFEGFGMAYAEAIARGLPVVGTTGGAIPDTVPPDAGVLVEPGDVRALARTLDMLIRNPQERRWLAEGARRAAQTLPTWQDSAKLFALAVEGVA